MNSECGMRKWENKEGAGLLNSECGLRPIGVCAYAPAGRWNEWNSEVGMRKAEVRKANDE